MYDPVVNGSALALTGKLHFRFIAEEQPIQDE